MEIRSDRIYRFGLARSRLWEAMSRPGDYVEWWPWIRQLDAAAGLAEGEVWHCTVQPPVPYALRGEIRIDTVVAEELVVAKLSGDLAGSARLELHDDGGPDSSKVRLVSELAASSPPIRLATRVMPTVARWGHNWVLDTAARQFARAVAERPR